MPSTEPPIARDGRIQTIDRAAAIMRVLATGPRMLKVAEIASWVSPAKPTAYGLLRTLEHARAGVE